MMKRGLIAGLVALGVAAGLPAGAEPVVEGPAVTWHMSNWGGPGRGNMAGMEWLVDEVKKRTGGRFEWKIAWGAALSNPKENLDGVRIGAFESAQICSSYHPGKNPATTLLDLPFLPIQDLDVMQAVHEAYFAHPVMQKEMARWNAVLYASTLIPPYEFLGRGKPPKTLEDFAGLRVRALGGMGDAMRILGAVPTTVPAPEVYTALERGTMDAVSFAPYAHGAFKTYEVAEWYTTNLRLGTPVCAIAINRDAWEALPPQYRTLLTDMKAEQYEVLKRGLEREDGKFLAIFEKRLQPVTYSEDDRKAFVEKAGHPVWEQWVKEMEAKGLPGRELLDFVLAEARKAGS